MGPYDDLDALGGPPVDVTEEMLTACRASDQFGPLVFELYMSNCTRKPQAWFASVALFILATQRTPSNWGGETRPFVQVC